ncbi:hypothetical protein [Parafilimonas terrae]|uniref:Uncharacterized protein n=1 Tax=Parafilimonas terrae TaxID=1465490 RepID=A0A1I5R5V9_9BACT|nr:hypothetical protein [Parafilimonas terrae]SFP53760.1 hypothetical protein SAMN05444277_10185 [Parafilimonas terrae]
MTAIEYSIIIACLLLAAFLVFKEIRRPNKARLVGRIVASVLAAVSLIFLAIPFHYNAKEGIAGNEVVLLTDGYNKDSVDIFLKQNKNAVVYTKDQYEQQVDAISMLHVFGYGLSKDEWQTAPVSNIVFHPSAISNGITAIDYSKQINSGDQFIVQGRYDNTTGKPVKLTLRGFGVVLDSVIIGQNQSQTFELKTTPKFIGRAVYDIAAINNKDTLEREQLPFEVALNKPLKVLLLAAYPDFENKFLQNWLSENNYVIAARTAISKNKYSYSYTDTGKFSLAQISTNVLEQFDVLIADGAALSSLSRQELFNISSQINDKGLGLIIKTDSTEKPALFYSNACSVAPSSNHNKQTLSVQLPGNDTASSLPVENAAFIKINDGARVLITDTKKNVLACNAIYGNGSIVFSAFKNSYYWMLSGDKKSYQLLWSSLIANAAKKQSVSRQWRASPAFPAINEPAILAVETISKQPLQASINNNFIAFAAQPYLPFEWKGIYWPETKGWQAVASSGGDTSWLYVFDKNDWKNIAALQNMQDTYAYAAINKASLHNEVLNESLNKKTIPAFYFFVVFMCCCILLWIEKKIS